MASRREYMKLADDEAGEIMPGASSPLVTIVLPTYNGARYLKESVESCLSQTYSNLEIIIVDDASTDETPDVIGALVQQDRRLRTIRHGRNRRLPGALNTGFAQAHGSYLTWTSDDNLYRPHAIATMVEHLESHPDVALVYTDFTEIGANGALLRYHSVDAPGVLVLGNHLGACFLYRRQVRDAIGDYDETLFLAEDYDYWLRAAQQFRLEPLHLDCYLYRVHGMSLSSSKAEQVLTVAAQVQLRHIRKLGWVEPSDLGFSLYRAGLRMAEVGRKADAVEPIRSAIMDYGVLEHYPDFVSNKLIYGAAGARPEAEFKELLALLPIDSPEATAFKRRVMGEYYGIRCFEDYATRQPDLLRRHFAQALANRPGWITNRGLVRAALWALSNGRLWPQGSSSG